MFAGSHEPRADVIDVASPPAVHPSEVLGRSWSTPFVFDRPGRILVVSIGEGRWTEAAILDASLNESDRNPRPLDMWLVVDCGLVPGNDAVDLLTRHRVGIYAHGRVKACR